MSIFRYLFLTLFIFAVKANTLSAAESAMLMPVDTIIVNVESATGTMGSQVCIDITVDSFTNISTGTFEINFNPNILQPIIPLDLSNSCFNTMGENNLTWGDFNGNQIDIGVLKTVWITDPLTFTNGCIFYTICFDIIGDPGDCSPLNVDITFTEFINDETAEEVPYVVVNGEVKVIATDLTCNSGQCNPSPGNTDGSYYFSAVAGTGPYTYTINNVAGPGPIDEFEEISFQDQPAGTYNLIITDAVGATCMTSIVLFESGDYPFLMTLDSILPTCFDKTNGTVTIASTSGGNPISFGPNGEFLFETQWSNGEFNVTEIDRLAPDCYGVTLTDALGCRIMDSVNIKIDTLKVSYEVISPPTCNGADDGVVRLTATGGFPGAGGNYDFTIEQIDPNGVFYNVDMTGNTVTYNDVPNGCLEITVRDDAAISCVSDPLKLIFDEGPNFTADLFFDVDPCIGGASIVKILPSISGAIVPTLFDDLGTPIPTINSPDTIFTLNPLPPGVYELNLRLAGPDCMLDTMFTVADNNPLIATEQAMIPTCMGDDGEITVVVDGGTEPYEFDWNIDSDGGDMRDGLGEGDYRITVTDFNGCTDTVVLSFMSGDTIPLSVIVTQNVSCSAGDDGIVVATVSGSTGFTFEWSDGTNNLGMGNMLSDLEPGIYYVTATDASGCAASDSIELESPSVDLDVDILQTDPSCVTSNDGVLSATVNNGLPPFTFSWQDPITEVEISAGQIFTGSSGDYLLSIEDDLGCTFDTVVTMTPPPNTITLDLSAITQVSCFDQCDGTAVVEAMGGVNPAGAFVYRVNGQIVGNSTDPITLVDLCPGQNWVLAFDTDCPSDTVFFDVPNQDEVGTDENLNILTNPICREGSTGSIEVTLIGVDPSDATLTWLDQGIMGNTITDIPAGEYYLEIAYGAGCTYIDTFELVDPEKLFLDIDPNATIEINCNGGESGRIQLNVFGGAPGPYTYVWSPDVSDTNVAEGLSAGLYEVTVTDSGGCARDTFYELITAPPVTATIPTPTPPACFGDQTCITVTNPMGGTGIDYTYSINKGPRIAIDSCVTLFGGDIPYNISVFDNAGCSFDTTLFIAQPEQLTVMVGPDQNLNLGQSSDPISAQPVSFFPIDSFNWSPITDLEFQTADQQIAIATPASTTTYTVTVTDTNGCTATDDVTITVEFRRNVYRPNAFSPNGDQVNDNFQLVTGFGVQEVRFFNIYDRWGNNIYQEFNYMPNDVTNPGWDGTYNGEALAPGVYVFLAEVVFDDGATIQYSGDVTLVR